MSRIHETWLKSVEAGTTPDGLLPCYYMWFGYPRESWLTDDELIPWLMEIIEREATQEIVSAVRNEEQLYVTGGAR